APRVGRNRTKADAIADPERARTAPAAADGRLRNRRRARRPRAPPAAADAARIRAPRPERDADRTGQSVRAVGRAALGRASRAVAERRGIAGIAAGGIGLALAVTGAPNGVPMEEPRGGEHAPVLRNAAIDALAIRADGSYVDATFGRGGHAGEILGRLGEEGKLTAIDRDPEAEAAAAVLFQSDPRARFVRGRFSEIGRHVEPASADGILFDLG